MENVISIYTNTQLGGSALTVDARELHKFLEVKRDFSNWIKGRIDQYSFIEDEDFSPILAKTSNGRPSKEYHLTLDMAKELAMVERTQKGKEARQYFIEAEKKLREQPAPAIDFSNPREVLAFAEKQIAAREEAEAKYKAVLPTVEAMEILEASEGSVNLTTAAKELDMPPRRFNQWLCSLGWIYRRPGGNWTAYQPKIAVGYLEHRPYTYEGSDGFNRTNDQVLVTAKGRAKLAKLRGGSPTALAA